MITSRSLRLACDLGKPEAALDPRTNLPPAALRGADLLLQLAAFRDGAIVADVSNYDSLTVVVRAVTNGIVGAVQFSEAIAGADLAACLEAAWRDGSDQQGEIAIDGDDLDLAQGTYKLIVYGITGAGVLVPWAHCTLTIADVGLVDSAPPDPADQHYTKTEADALFLRRTPPGGAFRLSSNGQFVQLKDSATGLWRSMWLENGVTQFSDEEA